MYPAGLGSSPGSPRGGKPRKRLPEGLPEATIAPGAVSKGAAMPISLHAYSNQAADTNVADFPAPELPAAKRPKPATAAAGANDSCQAASNLQPRSVAGAVLDPTAARCRQADSAAAGLSASPATSAAATGSLGSAGGSKPAPGSSRLCTAGAALAPGDTARDSGSGRSAGGKGRRAGKAGGALQPRSEAGKKARAPRKRTRAAATELQPAAPPALPEAAEQAEATTPMDVQWRAHLAQGGCCWTRPFNGIAWVGQPIPQAEVSKMFPHRQTREEYFTVKQVDALPYSSAHVEAVAHFRAAEIEDVGRVELGSAVEVMSGEGEEGHDITDLMLVTELFEDASGRRFMNGRWFYKPRDTCLAVDLNRKELAEGVRHSATTYVPIALQEGRVFLASQADNSMFETVNSLDSIDALTTVEHVRPGGQPSGECSYWYDQEHDRRFMTFIDSFDALPEGVRAHADRGTDEPRELLALDLYCGAGGLSFLDQRSDSVHIHTRWAVDFVQSMCNTFQANYPDSVVYNTGVNEFLMFSQLFLKLVLKHDPTYKLPEHLRDDPAWAAGASSPTSSGVDEDVEIVLSDSSACASSPAAPAAAGKAKKKRPGSKNKASPQKARGGVAAVLDMRCKDNATRGTKGQAKGTLEEELNETNTWLEFHVRWESGRHEWVKQDALHGCDDKVAALVQQWRRDKVMPLPGDVNIVMGGPPCQGVSGLNRHAEQVDVLSDPRNRQVLVFYRVISFFKPNYVIMENVLDILKKEDGAYAKFAVATLVKERYQTRVGVLTAAEFGVPQGRYRVFAMAALAGQEQLPAFPEPTHRSYDFHSSVPVQARGCRVAIQSEERLQQLHPMALLGDVLSDLPAVDTFTLSEYAQYASEAQTPLQLWLRRQPKAWQADAASRAERAERFMAPAQRKLEDSLLQLNPLERGQRFFCKKKQGSASNFAGETWEAHLAQLSEEDRRRVEGDMQRSKRSLAEVTGLEIAERIEQAAAAAGPLRDHRPLVLNLDDKLRVEAVPSHKGANFRQFQGVVSHPKGTCCTGSVHAGKNARVAGGLSECPAGGSFKYAKQSNCKTGRVDNSDKGGWRGTGLAGCPATTHFLPTGDLLCPRWCITYKKGLSNGRHGCFGRCWYDEIQPTVVGRAEPHNLALIHPAQPRVLTIRENARCQGFPDYFALVGLGTGSEKSWVRANSLVVRYQQMGNAVCPAVASALGRCLALAAVGASPVGVAVVPAPDPDQQAVYEKARATGLQWYVDTLPPGQRPRLKDDRPRANQAKRKACTAADGQQAAGDEECPVEDEDDEDDDDDPAEEELESDDDVV